MGSIHLHLQESPRCPAPQPVLPDLSRHNCSWTDDHDYRDGIAGWRLPSVVYVILLGEPGSGSIQPMSDDTTMLRHTIATLAYRLEKVVHEIPPGFDSFDPGAGLRTPLTLLGHIGDLAEWGERLAHGEYRWIPIGGLSWIEQRDRIFASLARTDARLAEGAPGSPVGQIFQGPIADALTHVGQLAMLRRMAGMPVRAESYARAEIEVGRVGRDQSERRVEFDGDASGR